MTCEIRKYFSCLMINTRLCCNFWVTIQNQKREIFWRFLQRDASSLSQTFRTSSIKVVQIFVSNKARYTQFLSHGVTIVRRRFLSFFLHWQQTTDSFHFSCFAIVISLVPQSRQLSFLSFILLISLPSL